MPRWHTTVWEAGGEVTKFELTAWCGPTSTSPKQYRMHAFGMHACGVQTHHFSSPTESCAPAMDRRGVGEVDGGGSGRGKGRRHKYEMGGRIGGGGGGGGLSSTSSLWAAEKGGRRTAAAPKARMRPEGGCEAHPRADGLVTAAAAWRPRRQSGGRSASHMGGGGGDSRQSRKPGGGVAVWRPCRQPGRGCGSPEGTARQRQRGGGSPPSAGWQRQTRA